MMRRMTILSLALAASAMLAANAQSQSLDLVLTNADQTVAQGTTTVVFDATLFNPSGATVYLNGVSANTSSAFLSVDSTPFFSNAPLSLAPDSSSGPFELFAVNLSGTTPTGSYGGNVLSILGGADGGSFSAFDDLADGAFSVTVNSAVVAAPEIDPNLAFGSITFLAACIAVAGGRRVARAIPS